MSDLDVPAGRLDSPGAPDACLDPEVLAIRRAGAARATSLKDHAETGGLRFEAHLPPSLALWLLARIARSDFADPSEAVFVMLGEQKELEQHPDLRRALLRRVVEASANDPRPSVPMQTVMAELNAKLAAPRAEPAIWKPRSQQSDIDRAGPPE